MPVGISCRLKGWQFARFGCSAPILEEIATDASASSQ